jgi:hypothetical protein
MVAKPRRGVLLLVVLALLAMFAMVAVAFVVLTGAEKRSADHLKTIGANDEAPMKTLTQGFNVVVRGPLINSTNVQSGTTSAIKWCSLLEKIYGYETIGSLRVPAIMSGVTPVAGGQLLEFTLPKNPLDPTTYIGNGSGKIDPFQCTGCVVTMLSGRCAGLSTHIVGIDPQTGSAQMAAFEGGLQPAANDTYIVNGFPYGGMGFGWNGGAGLGNLALTPNVQPAAWGNANGIIPGGVNSDYTAADFQDPLLALEAPNPNVPGATIVPIPSLHRSDLIQFFVSQGQNPFNNAGLLRQVMFRPNWLDNQNFTGSNPTGTFTPTSPNFNPAWDGVSGKPGQYSWDVDNQGTGVPDSVWVDLGLPVRFNKDGIAYKPLFAILCLDMDGRLNINAHGSYAQTQSSYYQPINVQPGAYQPVLPSAQDTGPHQMAYLAGPGPAVTTSPVPLPRGQGDGTSEVNLWPLLRGYQANYQALLSGSGAIMGRYGPATPGGTLPMSGPPTAYPGVNPGDPSNIAGSMLTLNNAFPYNGVMGGNYWTNFQKIFDAYGSPPDPQSIGAVALDRAGGPLYISHGGPVANGPYDIDLTRRAAHAVDQPTTPDNPFGVAEFEKVLRPYDRDSISLPLRLASLTDAGGGSFLRYRSAEFTVESEYVPVAPSVLPASLRSALPNARSIHPVDLLAAKIAQSGGNLANLPAMRVQLLPWEILQGLKMDLNRPFGSGAFSSAGTLTVGGVPTGGAPMVPDQPGMTREYVQQFTNASGGTSAIFNYSADGGTVSMVNNQPVNDSLAARQLYARHLFVLALALSDTGAILNDLKNSYPVGTALTADDAVRTIAQWAINVVAYRDHNGIMIPFPYDPNPFASGGWNPDNKPLHTVWGCKRPELLISETLAWHDRRTQDRNDEKVNPKKPGRVPGAQPGLTTDTGLKKDPSFNSRYRPQGSLFVELYNPWTALEPHTYDLAGPNGGVQLDKITAPVGSKKSPVWRLVIVDPSLPLNQPLVGDELPDPDHPIFAKRPTIERAAYFVPLTGLTFPTSDDHGKPIVSYCPLPPPNPTVMPPVVVPPRGYAVVGSGDQNYQHRSYMGFENGQTQGQPNTSRMVTLNQADLATYNPPMAVVKNTLDTFPTAGAVNPPQLLPVDGVMPTTAATPQPQRLSVSEPTKGYPPYEIDPSGGPVGYNPSGAKIGQYNSTLDIPVDQQRDLLGKETFRGQSIWKWLNNDGTIPAYRIIYLQRLADPTRPFVSDNPLTAGYVANPQLWNPYRTIDAMTVDLTTFNGLTSAKDPTSTSQAKIAGISTTYYFEARQRGERNYLPAPAGPNEMNIWKQEPAVKTTAGQVTWVGGGSPPRANMNFKQALNQTLGYLNQPFGTPATSPVGDPQYPFPWLYWSYRPFHNEYELLLVPALSSSRLLARPVMPLPGTVGPDPRRYFGYVDGGVRTIPNPTKQDPYDGSTGSQVPYPHLMNFFESSQGSKLQPGLAAQFSRLLAYVGVPSRFANAQLQIRAEIAAASSGPAHYFHTPFNRISRYREPGRINLNTVTSPDVLFGLMNTYYPSVCPPGTNQLNPVVWDKFVRSRRGPDPKVGPTSNTGATFSSMFAITGTAPSRFMVPYRSPGGEPLTVSGAEPSRESEVSLLRSDPDSNHRPLFELDDYFMGTGQANINMGPPAQTPLAPLGRPDNFPMACIDYNRNPSFRYQLLQKMGNAFSTHSNVFAIWITVGYFEALPNPGGIDPGHPDGYQLGLELGSETGDIVRHKAFFMFDRSIPVGFVRGQDINHANAILVKRLIQ